MGIITQYTESDRIAKVEGIVYRVENKQAGVVAPIEYMRLYLVGLDERGDEVTESFAVLMKGLKRFKEGQDDLLGKTVVLSHREFKLFWEIESERAP